MSREKHLTSAQCQQLDYLWRLYDEEADAGRRAVLKSLIELSLIQYTLADLTAGFSSLRRDMEQGRPKFNYRRPVQFDRDIT